VTLDASDPNASTTWVAHPALGPIVLTVVNDDGVRRRVTGWWMAALALLLAAGLTVTVWLLLAG